MTDILETGNIDLDRAFLRLLGLAESYDSKVDVRQLNLAWGVTLKAHSGQQRDNGEPYAGHPLEVATILAGYRLDTPTLTTALLHDVIEDTSVGYADIEQMFGSEIAGLVDGVTKLTRLELQSDRTKQAENFGKLVLAMSRDIRVLLVKLADRLHNMRTLQNIMSVDRRCRIARETIDIYAPLASRIGMEDICEELQTLAFKELEPEVYQTITTRLNFLRGNGADLIKMVKSELATVCHDAGIPVLVLAGREKSAYSIWQKMKRRNVDFDQLSDIMAFRLVVPTKADCYTTLGVVHEAFQVVAGRFKDYISTPKPNGYQALHTGVTVRSLNSQKIEVQIRSQEMHEIAERGVAAHWVYKNKNFDGLNKGEHQFKWVRDLVEILENSSTDEFLENTRLELYQDQVFCFSPKGHLVELPRGATCVDFAYAVHSEIGDTCVGARVNGRIVPLRQELHNGDQVEIITAKGGEPQPGWEHFVVTGKARARIRRYIQKRQRQLHADAGRLELAKAFRKEGLDGGRAVLASALPILKLADVDDIYIAVGSGQLNAGNVIAAAYPELRLPPRFHKKTNLHEDAFRTTGKRISVSGVSADMPTHFAPCCHPVPGDKIIGVVVDGREIFVHARTCEHLSQIAETPERLIDLEWDNSGAEKQRHTARIRVVTDALNPNFDALNAAITTQKGCLLTLKIVYRQVEFYELLIDIEVDGLSQLIDIIANIRVLAGIRHVERARN